MSMILLSSVSCRKVVPATLTDCKLNWILDNVFMLLLHFYGPSQMTILRAHKVSHDVIRKQHNLMLGNKIKIQYNWRVSWIKGIKNIGTSGNNQGPITLETLTFRLKWQKPFLRWLGKLKLDCYSITLRSLTAIVLPEEWVAFATHLGIWLWNWRKQRGIWQGNF